MDNIPSCTNIIFRPFRSKCIYISSASHQHQQPQYFNSFTFFINLQHCIPNNWLHRPQSFIYIPHYFIHLRHCFTNLPPLLLTTTQFRQFHHNLLSVHISRFNHLHMYLTSFSSCYAVTCSSTTLLRPSISLIYSCFISTELFEPSLAYTFPVTFSLFYAIVFTVDRQYCYILALTLLYSQATVHCYFQRPHS